MKSLPKPKKINTPVDPVARINLLEGVRGFLASWVMMGHFAYYLAISAILPNTAPHWLHSLVNYAKDGVTPVALFMIISGFVISHLIHSRREHYRLYITRRFVRLFPAFLCCLILGIFISPWQHDVLASIPWSREPWIKHQSDLALMHQNFLIQNIITHLTLLHGLVPRDWWPDSTGAFLGVGWSISTEWQFYLIAPLFISLSKKLSGLTFLCILLILLSPLFPAEQFFGAFQNDSRSLIFFHAQFFFLGGVSYSAWKLLREHLAITTSLRPPPQGIALCGLALACFIPNLTLAIWTLLFACLCQIASQPKGIESRIIEAIGCNRFTLFIGKISYSIYLVHWPMGIIVLRFWKSFPSMNWPAFVASYFIVTTLATIASATLLYYLVEAPAIRWGKKIFKEPMKLTTAGISGN